MKYEKPKLEVVLMKETDIITLSKDENEGGAYPGLPGLDVGSSFTNER